MGKSLSDWILQDEAVRKNMKYTFRKCKETDFDFIYDLKEKSFRWYVEKIYGWEEKVQIEFLKKEMAAHLQDMNMICYEGNEIGLLTFFYDEKGDACVSTFAILPEYQRQGIGTQILTHILEKNKGRRVYLQTFRDNPARKLYERVGFQKYGETQTHWLMERGRLIS